MNWTKVGLKAGRAFHQWLKQFSLNWTKVGLKASSAITGIGFRGGLNWTKVGLKATSGSGRSEQNGRFELD